MPASTWGIVRRLFKERFTRYWPAYAKAAMCMIVVSAMTALGAWLMKDVINRVFVARDQEAMIWLPAVIVAISLVKGIAAYLQEVWLSRAGNRLVAETQTEVFDHLLGQDVAFFQRHSSSDLITRITTGSGAARDVIHTLFVGLGRDLVTLFALVGVMITSDPVLAAIALLVGPVAMGLVRSLTVKAKRTAKRQAESATGIVSTLRETVQGIRIVKSFELETFLRRRMAEAVHGVTTAANRMAGIAARVNPMIEALGGVAVALVVLYAGWRTVGSTQTPGEFFSFLTALLMASDPARRLSRLQVALANSTANAQLMLDLLDTPPAESTAASTDLPALEVRAGEIRFDDVTFGYEPGNPLLNGFSLTVPAGKTTAIVGASGSGKTTLVNLLQRFWMPSGGRILIDGQDIAAVSLTSLRRNITFVAQDVFLFDGSVHDNIVVRDPRVTPDRLQAALNAAHATTFINALSQGEQTPVGELGAKLSGGQRQRLSIARAFLKDAPIVLLDEPTSALDSASETAIQDALTQLTAGKTTVVIAHRLATVAAADVIHVMDAGRIVESGTHADLLARGGAYARLHALQQTAGTAQPA